MTSVLNAQQLSVLNQLEGVKLVVAGPGTGKTTVVAHFLTEVISRGKAKADEILAVTFTNKAADELKKRVADMTGKNPHVSTIHSLAAMFLRDFPPAGYTRDFTILEDRMQFMIIKNLLRQHKIPDHPRFVMEQFTLARNLREIRVFKEAGLEEFYQFYMKKLRANNQMDFDGLQTWCLQGLEQNRQALKQYQDRFKYVQIDEFQDTSPIQYSIIKKIVQKKNNMLCVGDFDQSIYRFRGADVNIMLNLEKDFPNIEIIFLEQNYRSTPNINRAANSLIKLNKNRREKPLWSERPEGTNPLISNFSDEEQEAEFVTTRIQKGIKQGKSYSDFAIIYRMNAYSKVFEGKFSMANLPYQILGGTGFYQTAEIKNVLAFFKLAADPNDSSAYSQACTVLTNIYREYSWTNLDYGKSFQHSDIESIKRLPHLIRELNAKENLIEIYSAILKETGYLEFLYTDKSSQGEKRAENVEELKSVIVGFHRNGQGLSEFLSFTEQTNSDEGVHSVKLMTAHSAKGLEFDTVFVVGVTEGLFPHYNSSGVPDEIEEERRLFYVAITRAKNYLYLCYPKVRYIRGKLFKPNPSPFIKELTVFDAGHAYPMLDSEELKPGLTVSHPHYGRGHVESISYSQGDVVVKVNFYNSNTKDLLLNLAPLRIVK